MLALLWDGGRSSSQALADFYQAGYTMEQALEVITAVSLKTLSNLADHTAGVPLEGAFEKHRWEEATSAAV